MKNKLSKEAINILQQMQNGEKMSKISNETAEEVKNAFLNAFKGRQKITPEILKQETDKAAVIFNEIEKKLKQ